MSDPLPAPSYRPPRLLRDVLLLDFLELTGSTQRASRHLDLSQPSVSRRYQQLALDFGLRRDRRLPWGHRFGSNGSIRHLRLAARAHRLASGLVALGCDLLHRPLFEGREGLLLVPPRFLGAKDWADLLREGVVDAALVPGLELAGATPADQGVAVLELGELPLVLLERVGESLNGGGGGGPVLAPAAEQAPGLVCLLQRAGLPLQAAPRQVHDWHDWLAVREPAGLRWVVPRPLLRLATGATTEARPSVVALVQAASPAGAELRERLWLLLPEELKGKGIEALILASLRCPDRNPGGNQSQTRGSQQPPGASFSMITPGRGVSASALA